MTAAFRNAYKNDTAAQRHAIKLACSGGTGNIMAHKSNFAAELAQAKLQYVIAVANVSFGAGQFALAALENGVPLADVKTAVTRYLSHDQLLDLNAELTA